MVDGLWNMRIEGEGQGFVGGELVPCENLYAGLDGVRVEILIAEISDTLPPATMRDGARH